jgi:hypothetical protein
VVSKHLVDNTAGIAEESALPSRDQQHLPIHGQIQYIFVGTVYNSTFMMSRF